MPEIESAVHPLRDIHLPPPIGWWQMTLGFDALIVVVICLLLASILAYKRYRAKRRGYRAALLELEHYQQQYLTNANSQAGAAQISALLKRVALLSYPRHEVAPLQGKEWVQFLHRTSNADVFLSIQSLLVDAPYQAPRAVDISPLFHAARVWIQTQRKRPC